ncbi:hypothetical protein [Deinococcus deserti]
MAMQNRKSLKATLIATLFVASLSPQGSATSHLFFHNDSGASGMVDVYVNGNLLYSEISPDNHMVFPKTVEAGTHEFVVTRHKVAPGVKDLARKMLEVQYADQYTLKLGMKDDTLDPTEVTVSLDIRPR